MILESRLKSKRFFDPRSKKDMSIVKKFVAEQTWGTDGCPFYLEFPYSTIPDMIKDKVIHNVMGIKFNRFHHIGE
jgi:hypothetical protein